MYMVRYFLVLSVIFIAVGFTGGLTKEKKIDLRAECPLLPVTYLKKPKEIENYLEMNLILSPKGNNKNSPAILYRSTGIPNIQKTDHMFATLYIATNQNKDKTKINKNSKINGTLHSCVVLTKKKSLLSKEVSNTLMSEKCKKDNKQCNECEKYFDINSQNDYNKSIVPILKNKVDFKPLHYCEYKIDQASVIFAIESVNNTR